MKNEKKNVKKIEKSTVKKTAVKTEKPAEKSKANFDRSAIQSAIDTFSEKWNSLVSAADHSVLSADDSQAYVFGVHDILNGSGREGNPLPFVDALNAANTAEKVRFLVSRARNYYGKQKPAVFIAHLVNAMEKAIK